jgi:sugar phosphate isomerase/epimerase
VVFPLDEGADEAALVAVREAAREADLLIAEVGAWSNPLSSDPEERREALRLCKARLELADRAGARCCVNIAGSRGQKWDGPNPRDLTEETFQMIVETVREIIDAVQPARTFYTLEPMPWMYPDSADSYLRLLEAVDRDRFGVHFDPVNVISSPSRYFRNAELLREWFARLGPHIKSCHAKDTLLRGELTVHLDEVVPGRGALDYETYLRELEKLDPEMPLMLEHLASEEEYVEGADYIRSVAQSLRISLR